MYQTDKCVVAQVLKVVVIINFIIIDHSRIIQAFRFIEISKYDDGGQLTTPANLCREAVDASDQQIRLCCVLNLNLDYESVQIAWITHNSFKNNGGNMWHEILTFGKFLLYCDIIILYYCIIIYNIYYIMFVYVMF